MIYRTDFQASRKIRMYMSFFARRNPPRERLVKRKRQSLQVLVLNTYWSFKSVRDDESCENQ